MALSQNYSLVTPGRKTQVFLDVPEYVITGSNFPGYRVSRSGSDVGRIAIASGGNDGTYSSNVCFWPSSGCWTLLPVQLQLGSLQEYPAGTPSNPNTQTVPLSGLVVDIAQWTLNYLALVTGNQIIVEAENSWKQSTDTMGSGYYGGTTTSTGDQFLVKRVPAGSTWANVGLNGTFPAINNSVLSAPPISDSPMQRLGETKTSFQANQGFCLKWVTTGKSSDQVPYIWTFYFGQYSVTFGGDGWAYLIELTQDVNNNPVQRLRDKWRFAKPAQVMGTHFTILIWPHYDPKGNRYISFTSSTLEQASKISNNKSAIVGNTATAEHVYRVTPIITGTDKDLSTTNVTIPGILGISARGDIRIKWQVSMLGWATTGFIKDLPDSIPWFQANNNQPDIAIEAFTMTSPVGSNGTKPYTTGYNILSASTGNDFIPGTNFDPQLVINLNGDGYNTPIVWGYTGNMSPQPEQTTVSEITLGALPNDILTPITAINLEGPTADLSSEAGMISITDAGAQYPRLQTRGQFSTKISTWYATGGAQGSVLVNLARGYINRPTSERIGRYVPVGFPDQNAPYQIPRTYLAPEARSYMMAFAGMWHRLAEYPISSTPLTYANANLDPADPNQGAATPTTLPWLITDIIADILARRGFPQWQISIPTFSIRLWPGAAAPSEMIVQPNTDALQYIQNLAKQYLGAYVIYDPNLGIQESDGAYSGAWTIITCPIGNPTDPTVPWSSQQTYVPLWNFTTFSGTDFGPPQGPLGYSANTSPVFNKPQYTTIPPDFNAVIVQTSNNISGADSNLAIQCDMFNPLSFDCPNSSTRPDPNHPDYLGRYRPLLHIDAALGNTNVQGQQDSEDAAQQQVNWTCRRLFDFTCHGRVITAFQAPLVIIQDPNTGRYRPLRFCDPVSFNGSSTYIVYSANPSYALDRIQMCNYELIQPIASQQFA